MDYLGHNGLGNIDLFVQTGNVRRLRWIKRKDLSSSIHSRRRIDHIVYQSVEQGSLYFIVHFVTEDFDFFENAAPPSAGDMSNEILERDVAVNEGTKFY
jgi:hypothetical protein